MNGMKTILLVTALVATPVLAQQSAVKLKNEAFKEVEIVNEIGETQYQLVPAGKIAPQDEVVYVTTFTNSGDEPADQIVITNPIPNNSLYKAGTAVGAGTVIVFSADGGKTFDEPSKLQVKDADGGLHTATPEEYTHIRWILKSSLKPGGEGTVMFRTVIE